MDDDDDDTTVGTDEGSIEVIRGDLVVLSADMLPAGAPVPIGPEPCVVGRGDHCRVSIPDRHLSTSHCAFRATKEGICITDQESLNGTWVNLVRLKPGDSAYLVSNGRVRCGQTWFDVRVTGREQVPFSSAFAFGPLVGHSVAMRQLYTKLARVAPTDLSVLITGETGTGKELVAHAIHQASRRHGKPFITVDCTNIPVALAESKLFGHEKGSFTGAVARKRSPFVEANGGTIFLDELGDLPLDVQPKLLRALEARQIQAVGSTSYESIDVRVVAATRFDLHVEMNAKRFREDLYFRIVQDVVTTPPLRERPEDIPDLVGKFIAKSEDPGAISRIDPPAMDRLKRHDWPGNVRELRNVVLVALAHSSGGLIDFSEALRPHGGVHLSDPISAAQSYAVLMNGVQREYFTRLYAEANGNLSAMARKSGLARSRVRDYVRMFELRAPESPDEGGDD
jgi:DNA-binding NtrC family response regulator